MTERHKPEALDPNARRVVTVQKGQICILPRKTKLPMSQAQVPQSIAIPRNYSV